MKRRSKLDGLAGSWKGSNSLWMMPDDPVHESATTATVAPAAGGQFVVIRYDWADEGKPHDGVLIVRNADAPSDDDIAWVDSFHTGGKIMHLRGEEDTEGRVAAFTTYAAPEGPPWGWRIAISGDGKDGLLIQMYNVAPDGQVYPAVESRYSRASGR
jgi:hypothetical protein